MGKSLPGPNYKKLFLPIPHLAFFLLTFISPVSLSLALSSPVSFSACLFHPLPLLSSPAVFSYLLFPSPQPSLFLTAIFSTACSFSHIQIPISLNCLANASASSRVFFQPYRFISTRSDPVRSPESTSTPSSSKSSRCIPG